MAEVIGLISSIITVVDITVKLLNAIKDSRRLPQAFQAVAERLPLVLDTLRATEKNIQNRSPDPRTCEAARSTLQSCKQKAEGLRGMLETLAQTPDVSRVARYRAAVRSLGKETMVEKTMTELLRDVQLLAENIAVNDTNEESSCYVADLVEGLTTAIEEMADVPPSVPDSSVQKFNFTHNGSGSQINNTGDGTTINHVAGNQTVNSGRFEGPRIQEWRKKSVVGGGSWGSDAVRVAKERRDPQ